MTVLLILFTMIAFLIADHFVQKSRVARARQLAGERVTSAVLSDVALPGNIGLALNHTWIREEERGVLTIGIDEFINRFVGKVEDILLPKNGAVIAPAFSGFVLRDGINQLEIASPVHGRVVEVNQKVLRNPSLARKDPYGEGWLVKIRADRADAATVITKKGNEAINWLRAQGELAREFFLNRVPQPVVATMHDGGSPADGVLRHFDASVWREFQAEFAELPSHS